MNKYVAFFRDDCNENRAMAQLFGTHFAAWHKPQHIASYINLFHHLIGRVAGVRRR
jgi:hypothetical protein